MITGLSILLLQDGNYNLPAYILLDIVGKHAFDNSKRTKGCH